jgi:cell division protein FtsQ
MKEILESDSLTEACIIDDLYMIASAARRDTFIWAQMEQLNVLPDKEIEFIPAIGPGKVLLGDATGIGDKFKRLSLFYKEGLPKAGWSKYSTINLKFNNQIICTQNTY